jgi:integrase
MTGEQFSRAWDEYDERIKDSRRLLDFYAKFYESKELEFKRAGFNEKSIRDYRNIRYYLEDFITSNSKDIYLDEINRDWMNNFVLFMETNRNDYDKSKKVGGKYYSKGGLAGKTIKKRVGLFIGFFNWMDNESYFEFPKGLANYFKTLEGSEAVKAVLTKEEVNKLYKQNFSNERHNFIKDIFIFSCFTGMRWDDILTFNKKDIHLQKKLRNGIECQ